MFKSNALQRVMQLNVHSEIVRIQFQFVPRADPTVLSHIHGQRGHGSIEGEPPVFVARRICLEVHRFHLSLGFLRRDNVHEILLLEISLQCCFESRKTSFHGTARCVELHIRLPVERFPGLQDPSQVFHGLVISGHGAKIPLLQHP